LKLKDLLPTNNEEHPVERRLFEITLFLTVMVFYFWTIAGTFFGYQWPVMAIYAAGSILYSTLYVLHKSGVAHRRVTLAYYALLFIILGLAWMPSGGLKGAISYFFVLVFLSGLLVLDPRDFKLFILLSIGMVLGLTTYEFYDPEAAAPYLDQFGLLRDLAIANVIMLGLLAITMFIFKKAYARDRVQLTRSNNSLEREKRKAQIADRAKSAFLANISHEMRTPLNGIVGTAELLDQTELTEEQKMLVMDLVYSSDILRNLISDVLDLTMIEEDKMVLLSTQFDYHKVIGDVVNFFQPVVNEKLEINMVHESDYSIPVRLLGDASRLRQVLINLVNNALKFTEKGQITIRSKLISKLEGKVIVKTWVEDTGSGIAEEHQPFIFEKFHRDNSNPAIEGTGLGLAISKRIVTMMGGHIQLDESTGFGSVFSFTLPFEVHDGAEQMVKPKLNYELDFSGLKVLVAEDQAINQMVLIKMLSNLGVESIHLAENGQKAVEMALVGKYDFILMDIRMPEKSGIDAAREIMAQMTTQPVIIAITANALKVDQESCFEVGIKDFISKPFSMEVLRSTLGKYV
jgi:signal transduction histidine kinase/CheY-like chemotaxis protein